MIISEQIVRKLIDAGKLDDNAGQLPSALESLKRCQSINCAGSDLWSQIARRLSIPDLLHLNKGLTRAESFHHWCGGSAAAVIWTFRVVESCCPEQADDLADWILQRSDNPYLPSGSHNHGARSLREYSVLKRQAADNYASHLKREKKNRESAAIRRVKEQQQQDRAIQDRNNGEREKFLHDLSKKSVHDQLWQLANDSKYPVNFYPTCLARHTQEEVNEMKGTLRQALREKMATRCRGPWGKFKKRLINSLQEVSL